ncbi:hypothetical protein BDQ12DRAFT_727124 [Crucibulum laeve]|uniref:Uncharacterized protein n=1 Tax=Crucibulum laeve TaxID=68775 RepID=A0A5C3LQF3_9AGAR|nr:hypothetical protein BDQ12DRAFT_727124 [Crucibulum laeve]
MAPHQPEHLCNTLTLHTLIHPNPLITTSIISAILLYIALGSHSASNPHKQSEATTHREDVSMVDLDIRTEVAPNFLKHPLDTVLTCLWITLNACKGVGGACDSIAWPGEEDQASVKSGWVKILQGE